MIHQNPKLTWNNVQPNKIIILVIIKKFNTTETNLLKQDTAGNVATLKTDTKDLTHRLLSLIQTSNITDAMVTVKYHVSTSISMMESKNSSIGNKENLNPTKKFLQIQTIKCKPGFSLLKRKENQPTKQ